MSPQILSEIEALEARRRALLVEADRARAAGRSWDAALFGMDAAYAGIKAAHRHLTATEIA